MTMQTAGEVPAQPEAKATSWLRAPLIIAVIVLFFAATYAFAWYRAYRLSESFTQNAEASFEQGDFVDALSGYDAYDEAAGRYIFRGGYGQVVRIWNNAYAWPVPASAAEAEKRVDEIVNQHLTLSDAEGFIQANTGKANPYLGAVYLRTGELYEGEGDLRDARDVYESVADLFPNQPELIERAREHLNRLEQEGR